MMILQNEASQKKLHLRRLQKNASIDELSRFIGTTIALNRAISFDTQPHPFSRKHFTTHWNSIDDDSMVFESKNHEQKKSLMKIRPLRFSRTLDLESAPKFSSIDE